MTLMKLAISLLLLVLLLAGCAGLTQQRAATREAAAEAAFPPQGRFVTVDGLRVHAVIEGEGPDLVLIHGASGSTRDFTFSFVERIKDRYRVIAFDRPGLGYTDRLPEGNEGIFEQAALLSKAAAHLGAEKPIVVGHSLGGAVALAWALDHPAAALVTISGPSHRWETGLPLLYKVNSSAIGSALAVPLITAWVPEDYVERQIASIFEPQSMPDGYAEAVGAPLTLRRESLRANAEQRAGLKAEITAMQGRYGELSLPFELVHGDADTTVLFGVHAVPMASDAPTVHVDRLPGIGHMPHHAAADAVVAAIDRAAGRAGLRPPGN